MHIDEIILKYQNLIENPKNLTAQCKVEFNMSQANLRKKLYLLSSLNVCKIKNKK